MHVFFWGGRGKGEGWLAVLDLGLWGFGLVLGVVSEVLSALSALGVEGFSFGR